MKENYLTALLKCRLFKNIDGTELNALLECLRPDIHCIPKNSFAARSGDRIDGLGIILEGEASVYKESISGNRILIKNISEGEMFGEIAVFAGQAEWPTIVQAITPLAVCFISRDRITGQCANACRWHNTMVRNMLELVSQRAMMLNKKMEYISIKTMRSKLCTYFFEQYRKCKALTIILPMNRLQLADFLNVSRPSMSRELSRMREEKIIDYHLSTIKILDLEKLKAFCE